MSNAKSLNEGLNDFLQNLNSTCQDLYRGKYVTPDLEQTRKIKAKIFMKPLKEACDYYKISLADLKRGK